MKKAVLFLSLALIACCFAEAQSDPIFQHLPPDANNIIRVNLPVIGSKVDLPGLLSHLPMKTGIGRALKDPVSVGIDLHKDMYIAQADTASDSPDYTSIIFHLADSDRLASFIKANYPNVRFFRKPGQAPAAGEYLNGHDQSAADSAWGVKQGIGYAWNDQLAVLTVMHAASGPTPASQPGGAGEKPPSTDPPAWYIRKAVSRSQAILQGYAGSFFTTNQTFITGFSDDADLTSWGAQGSNFTMIFKKMAHIPGDNAMTKMSRARHLNPITHCRFENGRVLINSTTGLPADTAAILQKVIGRPFNEALPARLPEGNCLLMAAMHIDPSAILPLVKKYQPRLDSTLHKKGPDLYRLLNAFKGDFLLAAIAPQGDTAAHPKANFYFISTINDQSAFLDLAHQAHLIRDSAAGAMPDTGRSMLGKLQTAYTIQDSICVISRSRNLTDAYFTTKPHTPRLLSDEFRKNFFTLVVDIKAVKAFLQSGSAGNNQQSTKAQQIQAILGQFDRFIVTIGLGQGNEMTSSFEIRLTDPSVNSLKLLSGFFMH